MKRHAIIAVALLASAVPALADAGFSDDWSIQDTIIFGILMGMPFFLPAALIVSAGAATTRALVRHRRQRSGSRFGQTFIFACLACAGVYILGMTGFIVISELTTGR